MAATAINGMNASYVTLRMMSPPLVRSISPLIEVSFNRLINSLQSAGRIFLTACGRMMLNIVCL